MTSFNISRMEFLLRKIGYFVIWKKESLDCFDETVDSCSIVLCHRTLFPIEVSLVLFFY
jgi:hypothetical protein